MSEKKPSAGLTVSVAALLFGACLLLPPASATAGDSRLAQQETQPAQGSPPGLDDAVERGPLRGVFDTLLDILADLIHGRGEPGHEPGGGEQGASIDPSGHRMSQH